MTKKEPNPDIPLTQDPTPEKMAAADRVIATLHKDPELLAAVRAQLVPRQTPVPLADWNEDEDPLDAAIRLLKEGQAAFEAFCQANNIVRGVFGSSNLDAQNKNPMAGAWRQYMKEDAIPRNAQVAFALGMVFGTSPPPLVVEFLDYTTEYVELTDKWVFKDDGHPHTIGRNFPKGFDQYLEGVRDQRKRLRIPTMTHTAWAVLMVEHEFGQRNEGWTLHPDQAAADAYCKTRSDDARSRATREQYFTYEQPRALEVTAEVWDRLQASGQLSSVSNHYPKRGTVVTKEMIR